MKLLIIDDEEPVTTMLSRSLRRDGYDVLVATDGGGGLKIFEQELPDVVLTDLRMPGLNGIDVLRRAKEIKPEAEVIIITGYGDMHLAIECLQLDASDFITKPVGDMALSIALDRARKRLAMRSQLQEYTHHMEDLVAEKTRALEKSYKEIEALYLLYKNISDKTSLKEVLDLIIGKIREVVNCRILPAIFDAKKEAFLPIENYGLETINIDSSALVTLASMFEPIWVKDHKIDNLFGPAFDLFPQVVIPIDKDGEIVGSAVVYALSPDAVSEKDIRFIYLLFSQAAGTIRRIVLQDEKMRDLHQQIAKFSRYGNLVGKDHKMQEIYNLIADVARTNATVLIQGESGTGKELIARAIHTHSLRAETPFVVIDCSSYPPTLLEAELFGHEKGAFTGAVRKRLGCFERATGGTVFLDEIGEIPLAFQVKLLRVLQVQEFERLGGEETVRVDVRIIAATNKDLRSEVEKGAFREDLYYRLNIIPVFLPPLRTRKNDIPLLIEHFLSKLNSASDRKIRGASPETIQILMEYDWPGNVRELENTIEHAFILSKGEFISRESLPAYLRDVAESKGPISSFEENERLFLTKILEQNRWNKFQVAKKLQISRSTLYAKMKKYNIAPEA
ncbi:MAG: sigma-54 dependent transcriptional regulator [Pseudomonadota bacterium]